MWKSSSTFARRACDSAWSGATRSSAFGDQLVGADLGLVSNLLSILPCLGEVPLDLGLAGGSCRCEEGALLGGRLLAHRHRVGLGGPPFSAASSSASCGRLLDALADVLERGRRPRWPPCAAATRSACMAEDWPARSDVRAACASLSAILSEVGLEPFRWYLATWLRS